HRPARPRVAPRNARPPSLSAPRPPPRAGAIPAGEPPILNFRTRPVSGSKRATVPVESAIQTPPAPIATPPGELPIETTRVTWLVRGSTSRRRPESAPVTQIPRSPAARPPGELPTRIA